MIKVRNYYDEQQKVESDKAGYVESSPGRTLQAPAQETDVNKIIERFNKTGVVTSQAKGQALWGVKQLPMTYHEAQNFLLQAEESFMSFPASVRERFNNDPGEMLKFVGDDKNRAEAIKLGWIDKTAADEPKAPASDAVPAPVVK